MSAIGEEKSFVFNRVLFGDGVTIDLDGIYTLTWVTWNNKHSWKLYKNNKERTIHFYNETMYVCDRGGSWKKINPWKVTLPKEGESALMVAGRHTRVKPEIRELFTSGVPFELHRPTVDWFLEQLTDPDQLAKLRELTAPRVMPQRTVSRRDLTKP